MTSGAWKVCSICRKAIGFKSQYYTCSVSTCQRKRTGLVFCSPACFDAHLPMMKHRDAWAESTTSPSETEAALEEAAAADAERSSTSNEAASAQLSHGAGPGPVRRIASVATPVTESFDAEDEVLIVTSRLKKFIRIQSGMNTSDTVLGVLSEHVRQVSVQALRIAAVDGRKTVMDRDYEAALRALKSK